MNPEPKIDSYSAVAHLRDHYRDGAYPNVIHKMNDLLGQLSSEGGCIDPELLRRFFDHYGRLFLVRLGDLFDGSIVGMGTLVTVPDLDDMVGEVDNVVIDAPFRGRGYSRLLMAKIVECAQKKNLSALELTSRPSRIVANHLYPSLGFKKRDTNVWRLALPAV